MEKDNTGNSKKRQLQDHLSGDHLIGQTNYQEQNRILKELAMERQKRMQQTQKQQQQQQQQIQKPDIQQQPQQQKDFSQVNQKIIFKINEEKQQQQNVHTQKLTQFYLNKLSIYPEDQQTDYMVNFEQLLLEDPFYKEHNKNKVKSVQTVFMSTFGFCPDFLYKQIANQKQIHFVLANDRSKEDFESGTLPDTVENFYQCKNWTLIHPPKNYNMTFVGPFHPKIWLLKFPDFLRVVVTSGNLTEDDWITWGQGVWFQDFKRKNLSQMSQNQQFKREDNGFSFDQDFKESLELFMKSIMPFKQDYKQLLKIDLNDYIYEDVNIILIPGIQGRHSGSNFKKMNKGKIKHILSLFKVQNKMQRPILTYQTSSCGNINEDFLEEMLNSMSPDSESFEILNQNRKQRRKNKTVLESSQHIKLVYPTLQYLMNEQQGGGVDKAQVLCLNKDFFQKESFPKRIMHRFEGNPEYFYHQGVIPHTKVGIVTDQDMEITDDTVIYFGSHNFSKGAWGGLEKDMLQMFNANTEIGILFPPRQGSKQLKDEFIAHLPFKYPPEKYSGNDRPFMWGDMQ